jgi:hypothetical protein
MKCEKNVKLDGDKLKFLFANFFFIDNFYSYIGLELNFQAKTQAYTANKNWILKYCQVTTVRFWKSQGLEVQLHTHLTFRIDHTEEIRKEDQIKFLTL